LWQPAVLGALLAAIPASAATHGCSFQVVLWHHV